MGITVALLSVYLKLTRFPKSAPPFSRGKKLMRPTWQMVKVAWGKTGWKILPLLIYPIMLQIIKLLELTRGKNVRKLYRQGFTITIVIVCVIYQ